MFSMWRDTPQRRRRDQERVLRALWRAGHSRLTVRAIAGAVWIPEKRATDALQVLEAGHLASRLERTGQWALTMEGHRVAGVKAGAAARRAWP